MILITGATGHTGQFLLEELKKGGKQNNVRCLVRENSPHVKNLEIFGVEPFFGDMDNEASVRQAFKGIETVIHIVNIRYSPMVARISQEMGVKQIVFIHTTGMYSKFREYAAEYKKIERDIFENCKVNFIILRPSMIYGTIKDHNMHKLIQYIKTHNFFPIFGDGKNLMQPVHARDLAKAIVLAMESPNTINKGYDITGKSVLQYRVLLKLIGDAVNPKMKFIFIPYRMSLVLGTIYNFVFGIMGRKAQVSIEQIKRLSEDKSYSYKEASKDFGYSPISFEEGIKEEIKSMGASL